MNIHIFSINYLYIYYIRLLSNKDVTIYVTIMIYTCTKSHNSCFVYLLYIQCMLWPFEMFLSIKICAYWDSLPLITTSAILKIHEFVKPFSNQLHTKDLCISGFHGAKWMSVVDCPWMGHQAPGSWNKLRHK